MNEPLDPAAKVTPDAGGTGDKKDEVKKDAPAEGGEPANLLDPKNTETPEQKTAREAKAAADAVLKKKFESKADVKVKDGSPLGLGRLDQIIADAKAKGLTVGETQALVDQHHEAVSAFMDSERARLKTQAENWVKDLQNHPTLGGDKYPETVALAHRGILEFAPEALIKVFSETGMGNHPLNVEAWAAVGRAMADDKFVRQSTGSGDGAKKDITERFYGQGKGLDPRPNSKKE